MVKASHTRYREFGATLARSWSRCTGSQPAGGSIRNFLRLLRRDVPPPLSSFRSSPVVTLAQPSTSPCLKITNRSSLVMLYQVSEINFLHLVVNLILVPVPLFPTHLFLHLSFLPLFSPLCSSIASSLFHCRLKIYLFHKSFHVVSLLSLDCLHGPFLRSYSVLFLVFPYFFMPCAGLS